MIFVGILYIKLYTYVLKYSFRITIKQMKHNDLLSPSYAHLTHGTGIIQLSNYNRLYIEVDKMYYAANKSTESIPVELSRCNEKTTLSLTSYVLVSNAVG